MTFWQFLDRQIGRLSPSGTAGAGIFMLTGVVLLMVYNKPALANVDLFKTLAQAIIVQGLVGLAMAAWFTKKAGDDKVQDVNVVNPNPLPVEETNG